ncbi:MAG: ATP-binding protein [Puniceicoccales bacterium]|jgi:hypothetical protein|nr:ATP-binding protein [Puniceicoccales bacterium]
MQKLPIGIQAFSELRKGDYAYVDKTAHVLRLVTEGKVYFLSRPRRFGKSLLLSTLDALFRGEEALFRGLAIHDKWDWTQKHPVVRLDWSTLAHGTDAAMSISTSRCFADIAAEHGIALSSTIPSEIFNELLKKLRAKTGAQPVVLIDEYDKPILDSLEREDGELERIRDFLRNLYGVLKGNDEHLRFVFLTGVSRFAGVSIFSGLNNLRDITIGEDYSTVCGYTQEELERVFSEEIKSLAVKYQKTVPDFLDGIRKWYNGYSWDGITSVYNPYSTLNFIATKAFSCFWFRSGTPTFLTKRLTHIKDWANVIKPFDVTLNDLDRNASEEFSAWQLLFQTGYLTIKKTFYTDLLTNFTLDIPNFEVRDSLMSVLLMNKTGKSDMEVSSLRTAILAALKTNDTAQLEQSLRRLVANIPYTLKAKNEAAYHIAFLVAFSLLGFQIEGEIITNVGRIDAVLHLPNRTIVVELKYAWGVKNFAKPLAEALSQIKANHYADRYTDGRKITNLAIAFSGKDVACKIEE